MTRTMRRALWICGGICALATVVVLVATKPAMAQGSRRPDGDGEAHLEAKVGSFKLLAVDPAPPPGHTPEFLKGDLKMTCTGTFLITGSGELPEITISGNLKKEYEYKPLNKVAYHGTGTVEVKGTWTSLQWFGTDLTASFIGRGKFRLVGEFDKNLRLGTFWTKDPNSRQWWPANNAYDHFVPGYVGSADDENWHGKIVPLSEIGK